MLHFRIIKYLNPIQDTCKRVLLRWSITVVCNHTNPFNFHKPTIYFICVYMHSIPFPIGWRKQFIALVELLFASVELQGFSVWKSLYAVSQDVNFSGYWLLRTSFLLWPLGCKVVPSAFWEEHLALHRNSLWFIPQVIIDGSQRTHLDALMKECVWSPSGSDWGIHPKFETDLTKQAVHNDSV